MDILRLPCQRISVSLFLFCSLLLVLLSSTGHGLDYVRTSDGLSHSASSSQDVLRAHLPEGITEQELLALFSKPDAAFDPFVLGAFNPTAAAGASLFEKRASGETPVAFPAPVSAAAEASRSAGNGARLSGATAMDGDSLEADPDSLTPSPVVDRSLDGENGEGQGQEAGQAEATTSSIRRGDDVVDDALSSLPSSSGGARRRLSDLETTDKVSKRLREEFRKEMKDFFALPRLPKHHCFGALPNFKCLEFYRQRAVVRVPPPRGALACPNNCSGSALGVCDHDSGRCRCPAGFGGPDCGKPRKRPCFSMGPDKRDKDTLTFPDWSHSRCSGICDDDLAMCYCPPETRQGRIEAPPGSPPGTPPVKAGRPMFWCHLKEDKDGNPIKYGAMSYEALFGKEGWCNADEPSPENSCPCRIDGVAGTHCNFITDMFCPNQCSGKGECVLGFCKCREGFYGHDCAARAKGWPDEVDDSVFEKPYLQAVLTRPPVGEDPPLTEFRARPLIYVYDLPPELSSDMLQYRIEANVCAYRRFHEGNASHFQDHNYMLETAFHEMLLTSTHRTLDPEEADFFYVPVYSTCLFSLYNNNQIPAFPPGVLSFRPFGASNMQLEAKRWVERTYPYWTRRGGRDHIWLNLHDEGSCYVHKEVWPSIHLSHWGRKDFPHLSNTQYFADNYSGDVHFPDAGFPKGQWTNDTSGSHPCFDPEKDLVVPAMYRPDKHRHSPFLGNRGAVVLQDTVGEDEVVRPPRDLLLAFRGDVAEHRNDVNCIYSRCIRQTLRNISIAQNWTAHKAYYGPATRELGEYGAMLSRANFSLVLPGDGWSARLEDSMLHGCIPVIVMDDVDVVFENILDYAKFSIRVKQSDMHRVLELVRAVTPEKVVQMQEYIANIWHRFRYNRPRLALTLNKKIAKHHLDLNGKRVLRIPGSRMATTQLDDAFDTIMQWLFSRIPKIHGTSDTGLSSETTNSHDKKWFQVANLYLPA